MTAMLPSSSSVSSKVDAIHHASWIWCNDTPQVLNQYAYFRRSFEVTSSTDGVILQLAADTRYRLYINGTFLGDGQARYHAAEPSYVTYDLTPYLHSGRNVVAVLVHGYGEVKRCSSFYTVRCGLIAAIARTFADGRPAEVIRTDDHWKCYREQAYAADTPRLSNHQGYVECFDARKALFDWASPSLDDRHWSSAVVLGCTHELAPWSNLVEHTLPSLTRETRLAVRAIESGRMIPSADYDVSDLKQLAPMMASAQFAGDDAIVQRLNVVSQLPLKLSCDDPRDQAYVVFDFGQVSAGYLQIDIEGRPGTVVDLGYSEGLQQGEHETFKQGCRYVDRFILGSQRITHGPILPKSLRYLLVAVKGQAVIHGISQQVSTYPMIWRGRCYSSDPVLDAAWQIGTHTVQISAEDTFIDTPRRERAGWLADMRPEAVAAYYAFGDYALARHSIELFFKSQDQPGRFLPTGSDNPGWLLSRYPSIDPHRMPDYNVAMTGILHDYLMHSGDVSLLEQLWPQYQKLVKHHDYFRRDDGLYEFRPYEHNHGTYNLTDWAPTDNRGAAASLTMHYADHLRMAAELARRMSDDALARNLESQYTRTCEAIRDLLWDESRGLFVNGIIDGRRNTRAGYHENLLALLYNIADDAQADRIRQTVLAGDNALPLWQPDPPYELYSFRRDGLLPEWDDSQLVPIGSPFFSYYAVWALLESGMAIKALNTIREQWGSILQQGATTVWEEWDGSKGRSHGWGAGPTWLLLSYVLGVIPAKPGFAEAAILPSVGDLSSMKGRVPTPQGYIEAQWSVRDGRFTLSAVIPSGMRATLGLPAQFATGQQLLLNHQPMTGKRISLRRGDYLTVDVTAGQYVLST